MDAKKLGSSHQTSPTDGGPSLHVGASHAPSPREEQVLLARAASGEDAAWELLYNRFTPRMHVRAVRLLAKYGPRHGHDTIRQHAEDLVHSAWQHLFHQREAIRAGFDPQKGTLSAFWMTIAHRQMLSVLRSNARRPWLDGDESEPAELKSGVAGPEQQAESRQTLARLQGCMEQEVLGSDVDLMLRIYLEDEDIATLALEKQMTRAALDQRMSRARRRLRKCLEALGLSS